jgi:rubrerythrin
MGKPPVGRRKTGSEKGVEVLEETRIDGPTEGDLVEFALAGARAHGEFHCSGCGYGVAVYATLPQCPMCASTTWEPADWSPFTRARERA